MERDEFIQYLKNRVKPLENSIKLSEFNDDDTSFLRGELYATVHMLSVITGDYSRENTTEVLVADGGEHF
jgi:hypothetical protein